MQTKMTQRFHLTTIKVATIEQEQQQQQQQQNSPNPQTAMNTDKDVGGKGTYALLVEMYVSGATMEISMEVHQEAKSRPTL
jgi:hypothetical protein